MKKTSIFSIALILLLCVIPNNKTAGMTFEATGSWSKTITSANLTGGAGSDLTSTYESGSSQATCSIDWTWGIVDSWRVDVHKVDGTWDANLKLYIKRTSDGWNLLAGRIDCCGTSYQEVTSVSQAFFYGYGNVFDIAMQFQLAGISVSIPAGTYSTTVYLTLVDT
jgi:hypothetical protein